MSASEGQNLQKLFSHIQVRKLYIYRVQASITNCCLALLQIFRASEIDRKIEGRGCVVTV